MILLLYVDDLFLTGKEKLISRCKKNLVTKFEIKYLGMMHYFLGLEVWEFPNEIFLNQGKYAAVLYRNKHPCNRGSGVTKLLLKLVYNQL